MEKAVSTLRVLAALVPLQTTAAALLLTLAVSPPVRATDALEDYAAAIAADLDPLASAALERISGFDRRLLAMRAYLRSANDLARRWSWTQAQIDAFQGSPIQVQFEREVERVRVTFAERNPGYTLEVNPQVRSLDTQIERWNSNESVAMAATQLQAAAAQWLATAERVPARDAAGREAFAQFLRAQEPEPTPTLAAPGLSLHGQMRAVDFHVYRGEALVAGPEYASIAEVWDAGGWRERLEEAIATSGAPFDGPLRTPDEPWHYEYRGTLEPGGAEASTLRCVSAH